MFHSVHDVFDAAGAVILIQYIKYLIKIGYVSDLEYG